MLVAAGGSSIPSDYKHKASGLAANSQPNPNLLVSQMSARRLRHSVLKKLQQASCLHPAAHDTLTGLQRARHLQSMSSGQPASETAVQQISQWWERQWHLQQSQHLQHAQTHHDPYQEAAQPLQTHQHHSHQQQQTKQHSRPSIQLQHPEAKQPSSDHSMHADMPQVSPHPASVQTERCMSAAFRQRVPAKRRRSRTNIPSTSTTASSATHGSATSRRATRSFKSILAGSRFRTMDTAAELLAQAQMLQSQQDQAAEQAFQQQLHLAPTPAIQSDSAQSQPGMSPTLQASPSDASEGQLQNSALSADSQAAADVAWQQQQSARGEAHAAAAQRDMQDVALDIVESQLPLWSSRPALDWSAQQDLSMYHPQAKMRSAAEGAQPILTRFSLEERGEQIEVQPLWVLVHQEHSGGLARLYETVHTVHTEVLEHIAAGVQPFCYAEGMIFRNPKFSHGPWKGYLVGAVGDIAASEDDALWPNRLFCDKRVMHNVRNAWDIAKFLAEPTLADMAGHHANLKLIQEDRHYHSGWVWRMLSTRWGELAVAAYQSNLRKQHGPESVQSSLSHRPLATHVAHCA